MAISSAAELRSMLEGAGDDCFRFFHKIMIRDVWGGRTGRTDFFLDSDPSGERLVAAMKDLLMT